MNFYFYDFKVFFVLIWYIEIFYLFYRNMFLKILNFLIFWGFIVVWNFDGRLL